jgi:sugar lactone lactonase YvrE
MRKIVFTAFSFCLLMSHTMFGQSYNSPESVEFDYANNRYLIANKGANQILARAADGTLSIFANAPGSPHGIEIVGDTLYCNTGGSLRGFNLNTGTLIFNQTITGASFLNGITHDPFGNLYLTCFSTKKVFRFNTATRQFNTFVNNTVTTPNGIIYDSYDGITPRLVLAGWGTPATIKSISLADSSVSLLVSTPFGSIDGIAKGKNGNFYISCWSNNSIQRYDSTFANAATAMVTTGISSPADILYNQVTDTLAVPYGSSSSLNPSNVKFYFFGNVTAQKSNLNVDDINFYPNPTAGIINISGINAAFKIVNLNLYEMGSGKQVFSENLANLNENTTINFKSNQLSAGIYLLELNSNDGIVSRKKLIIE